MKNEALYNKTVGILVDAYFNDTLQHGNCHACAVGNLVAANCGYKFVPNRDEERNHVERIIWHNHIPEWPDVHSVFLRRVYIPGTNSQRLRPELFKGRAKLQIESTGYTFLETAAIEKAFENVPFLGNEEDYMFNGLMAVIDALDKIHENTDATTTQKTKNKFTRKPQTTTP